MIEIPDGMSDDEFKEFYWSKTDEERVEIDRTLARQAYEGGFITDEQYAECTAKIDRHVQIIALQKRAHELQHRVETAKQIVEDRIHARFVDMIETQSPTYFDGSKEKKGN